MILYAMLDAASPAQVLTRVAHDHGFDLIAVDGSTPGERRDGSRTVHDLAIHAADPLLVVGDAQGEVAA